MNPFGIDTNVDLSKVGKDETKLHLIADMHRLGANIFATRMEYTYFAPRSGKNGLFEMILLKWQDLHWTIVSFPIGYKEQAETLATECGLRFADGIPHIISDKVHEFPVSGETVFTLENISGHTVYENVPKKIKELSEQEWAECQKIIDNDHRKLVTEMKFKGYADDQINRILSQWEQGNEGYDEKPNGEF